MNAVSHRLALAAGWPWWSVRNRYGAARGKIFEDNTFLYQVPVATIDGTEITIYANGFNRIVQPQTRLDTSEVAGLFSVPKKDVDRPYGDIDLLLCSGNAKIFPFVVIL